jgi:hypothetical protein
MADIKNKSKHIARMWSNNHRGKEANSDDLRRRMKELREKISAAWEPQIRVVDEIKSQRAKPYDSDHR